MARGSPDTPRADGRSAPEAITLLVVDDDLLHARVIRANLERPGRLKVEIAGDGDDALQRLAQGGVDAVLTDVMMPGMDGIELMRRIRASGSAVPVVLMTAHATLERAVEGIRAGATDFIAKPVNADAVVALVERAIAERPVREELAARVQRRASPANYLFGDHPRLDEVRRFAERIATVPTARVLATGESGTGKSLLARAIHDLSGATGRFVEINCAALPAQLLESELFGHEKGAFTDARGMKRGLFEAAERGTLLLDEIGTMPPELQAKLLLVLESREVRRVGGITPIPVRCRVVAATNEDLRELARAGRFRQDLLYRLDVAAVRMPSLREMPEVVPPLAERFARDICAEFLRPCPVLSPRSVEALLDYPWPGNSRELRNAVERALIFHSEGDLVVLPPEAPRGVPGAAARNGADVGLELGLTLEEVERRYLAATLERATADLAGTAAQLGISRKTLWDKRRRYGL